MGSKGLERLRSNPTAQDYNLTELDFISNIQLIIFYFIGSLEAQSVSPVTPFPHSRRQEQQ